MRNGVMSSVFFFKQKTADELRISDWSSDVCSSDLLVHHTVERVGTAARVVDGFGTRGQPAKQRPTSDLGLGDEAHHVLAVQQHDIEPVDVIGDEQHAAGQWRSEYLELKDRNSVVRGTSVVGRGYFG